MLFTPNGRDWPYFKCSVILDSVHVVFKRNVPMSYLRICISLAGYGNVVELRINSGGKLPNFGFVVFDDSEPVQKGLSQQAHRAQR